MTRDEYGIVWSGNLDTERWMVYMYALEGLGCPL